MAKPKSTDLAQLDEKLDSQIQAGIDGKMIDITMRWLVYAHNPIEDVEEKLLEIMKGRDKWGGGHVWGARVLDISDVDQSTLPPTSAAWSAAYDGPTWEDVMVRFENNEVKILEARIEELQTKIAEIKASGKA